MRDLPMSDPIFDVERKKPKKHTTGTLYALSSTGKIKIWEAEVREPAMILVTHGYIDGKLQTNRKDIEKGKNIGKANETTPWEQAVLEVESKAQKKIDEGYSKDKSNLSVPILPMLAHSYEKRQHNIVWPAAVQPKIDGIRCTCTIKNNKIVMFTRKGKSFTTMPHIIKDLIGIFNTHNAAKTRSNFYLDGELYSDTLTFQELAGAVRREDNSLEYLKQIHFRVFDCFDLDNLNNWPFKYRFRELSGAAEQEGLNWKLFKFVKLVPTITLKTPDQLADQHNKFIQDGYEGTIIRNFLGQYVLKHRSADLQKYKSFLDKEFEIINYKQGEGNETGCVIWQCKTPNSQTFWVRPQGTREEREVLYTNGSKYIGSKLTVRYQELTDDGIPRFPVGLCVRDYE